MDVEVSESFTIDSDDDFEDDTESGASVASGSRKRNAIPSHARLAKKQKVSKKKRDEVGDLASSLDSVNSSFGKVFEEMNSSLVAMTQVWTNEDERKKRFESESNKILEEVLKWDVLSPSDALEVTQVLMGEEHKLRLFFQANNSLMKQYVADLLRKRN